MWGGCCQCDDRNAQGAQEIPFKGPLVSDTPPPQARIPYTKKEEPAATQKATPQAQPPQAAPASYRSQGSMNSLTPSEKANEKLRLQELVKGFAREAVRGVECDVLDVKSGTGAKKVGGGYSLDKSLNMLTFRAMGLNDTTIPLADIQEIYRIEDFDDGDQTCVEMKSRLAASSLAETEKRRALLVTSTASKPVMLLEADELQKERFITCVKILRLYCQTTTPESAQN